MGEGAPSAGYRVRAGYDKRAVVCRRRLLVRGVDGAMLLVTGRANAAEITAIIPTVS
jgi:hypothetical protein